MTSRSALLIVILVTFAAPALAQTPGVGDTRPSPPAVRDAPRGGDMEKRPSEAPGEKAEADADVGLSRCRALEGRLREDCLRDERRAAGGASRAPLPATAPPPQRPR